MSTPPEGPCEWPINTACCTDWDTYEPDVQAAATAWATYILWALTGRRYGGCPVTVRPCGGGCPRALGWMTYPVTLDGGDAAAAGGWVPYVDAGGAWRNCACAGGCSCSARCEVWLPGPVASVASVTVDGVAIDPGAYRIDNAQLLVRTDGECWPECQDLNEDAGAPDTFEVVYTRGTAVPVAGQIAAGKLACDYAKSCATGCKLPGNLSSLSRQGVDVQLVDPTEILAAGLTGVAEVDTWIRAVNPYRLAQRSRFYSPDLAPPRVVSIP